MKPKLRYVRVHSVHQNGYDGVVLEDPLGLSPAQIFVPQGLIPLLPLMDGTRDVRGLQIGVQLRQGYWIPEQRVNDLVQALDKTLMLENERFDAARRSALDAYRAAPFRPLAHAGAVYPEDVTELVRVFSEYESRVGELPPPLEAPIRAVIAPHIDYSRGGPVYAGVWRYAREAARQAEQVIVLGTDHNGDFGTITLTRQSYATPYGVLPTRLEVVDALAAAIGEEEAFREELHHRSEHSIELALVWLHYARGGTPVEVIPVLMGSFAHFTAGRADPAQDEQFAAAVRILREAMADRPTLLLAGADLAHVGPAFGDLRPLGASDRVSLRRADDELIRAMVSAEATRFFQAIAAVEDRYRICGLPPIYLLLRLLGGGRGVLTGYDQCPADDRNGSVVSICAVAIA